MTPFKSDGCSGGMSLLWPVLFGKLPPWEGCCVSHDRAYWAGGTDIDRLNADMRLFECVKANGHPYWALLMWCAVRVFGHPSFNFGWRWGYGCTETTPA